MVTYGTWRPASCHLTLHSRPAAQPTPTHMPAARPQHLQLLQLSAGRRPRTLHPRPHWKLGPALSAHHWRCYGNFAPAPALAPRLLHCCWFGCRCWHAQRSQCGVGGSVRAGAVRHAAAAVGPVAHAPQRRLLLGRLSTEMRCACHAPHQSPAAGGSNDTQRMLCCGCCSAGRGRCALSGTLSVSVSCRGISLLQGYQSLPGPGAACRASEQNPATPTQQVSQHTLSWRSTSPPLVVLCPRPPARLRLPLPVLLLHLLPSVLLLLHLPLLSSCAHLPLPCAVLQALPAPPCAPGA